MSDVGDHVVVINAKEVALSGNKWEQKTFHSHTGYVLSSCFVKMLEYNTPPCSVTILSKKCAHYQYV